MTMLEQLSTVEKSGRHGFNRDDVRMALIVTRREVRDSFRDWRIIIPILLLTLFFPALMNFTAGRMLGFVGQFGAELIAERLVPFLLLVVGFFPMSFSLVIALETFVGEKERKSLEPLLATPLTNVQLYVGKMMAAVIPPLLASYIGITVYLVGLAVTARWYAPRTLLVQALLITTVQGVVMVAGAVVVSSQTTSVRASNLLASFIIVPMALLLQAEAVALFYANYAGLWWVIVGLLVTAIVLVRMGIHLFNREELLGRDIDQIKLGWMFRFFWRRYVGRTEAGRIPGPLGWYRETWGVVGDLKMPAFTIAIVFFLSIVLGSVLARRYVFPPAIQVQMTGSTILDNLSFVQTIQPQLPFLIFMQNVRVVLLQAILGVFSFGVMGILVFMLPWSLLSFGAAQLAAAGQSPFAFLLATVIPHAIVELPALWLVAAAALRWQILLVAPPPDRTVSESWLAAAADFFRLLVGIALPLLLLSAFIEAYITPLVLQRVYGG
ncbi:MAG: stage II sporulation protein M [Ardenticatenales bacterium]|nr:stage II sporulation protein M [Ardenticatenales bacterium]